MLEQQASRREAPNPGVRPYIFAFQNRKVKAKDLQTELRVGVRDNSNPNPTLRNFGFRFLPGLRGTKPRTAKPCAYGSKTHLRN